MNTRQLEYNNFISKYIKSFGPSRYRAKNGDDELWREFYRKYSIEVADLPEILAKNNKIMLEIGSGCGDLISHYAMENSEYLCIGSDVYKGGLISTLQKVKEKNLENVGLFFGDGRLLLDAMPENSLKELYILFPDPWPKARHANRRIITYDYLSQILPKIAPNGKIICATDDPAYQTQMQNVCNLISENSAIKFEEISNPNGQICYITTKYHRKAIAANRVGKFFILKK